VINEALAQALFRGAPALGRTLKVQGDPRKRTFTVIGVVANTRYYDLHTKPGPAGWIRPPAGNAVHAHAARARATGDVASVAAAVRQEFDAIDKGFPIFNIKTLEARVEDSLARERMVANISVTFGGLALVLAGVGLYGILAYSVRGVSVKSAFASRSGRVAAPSVGRGARSRRPGYLGWAGRARDRHRRRPSRVTLPVRGRAIRSRCAVRIGWRARSDRADRGERASRSRDARQSDAGASVGLT
jgi:hypothetical protein